LVAPYVRGDLEALDALVDDDDAGELLVMVTEILVGAFCCVWSVRKSSADKWMHAE
jgi:hypothetical protein